MSSAPWRVLYVVPSLEIGGTERALLHLVRGIDRTRFCCSVLCLKTAGEWAEEAARLGVEVRVARLRGPCDLAGFLRVARAVRGVKPDLVHSFLFPANLVLRIVRLLRRPLRIDAFRLITAERTMEMEHTSTRILNRMTWWLGDRVVAVSDSVAAYARKAYGVSAARIRTIRNGVDLFPVALSQPRTGRAVITCVGRLERVKGQDLLLRAAAMLPPDLLDRIELIFVGDGAEAANLGRLAENLGLAKQIRWAGKRADATSFYLESTCVVVPSRHEGLPNAVLEAMAASRPVIATRVGGTAEAVEDGVTGFLVPPGDPGLIAEAIRALLVDPALAARMGAAGRKKAAREFSMQRMVAETELLYGELLGGARV